MNRSFEAVSGSPGFTFETKKLPDGNYQVTCPTIEGKEWVDDTEFNAINLATREVHDMVTKGELSGGG